MMMIFLLGIGIYFPNFGMRFVLFITKCFYIKDKIENHYKGFQAKGISAML